MSDYYSAADFNTGSRKDRPREAPRPGPVTGDYWDSRPKGGPSGSGATSSSGGQYS